MTKNRVSSRKLQIISEAIEESHQLDLLSFISDQSMAAYPTKEKTPKTLTLTRHGVINEAKSFKTFCLGDSNQFAVESIKRFIQTANTDFNMIYLTAGSGLGKTHILNAVANELLRLNKSYYLTSPLEMLVTNDYYKLMKAHSFILIDDFEEIDGNKELQRNLCQLIDFSQAGKCKIIFAGGVIPKDFSNCEEKLRAKLSAALIHRIHAIDSQLAQELVEFKCEQLNLNLSLEMRELVSRQTNTNVYGIESLLNNLKNKSIILSKPISLKMILDEISIEEKNYHRNHFERVLIKIAKHFQLSLSEMKSPVRKKEVALARHAAMFILKEKMNLSVVSIASIFSKDHSSVVYGISRIKLELQSDSKLQKTIKNILLELSLD